MPLRYRYIQSIESLMFNVYLHVPPKFVQQKTEEAV